MTEQRESIVVGIDGSDCSLRALSWAKKYAEAVDADVTLVTAWHWPTSYGAPLAFDGFDPEEDARKVVEAAAADVQLPAARVHTVVEQGPAGNVLIDAAKSAALLVVGTRGHGLVTDALLGSTSLHCSHRASCPVVVVR